MATPSPSPTANDATESAPLGRRGFFARASAIVIGAFVVLVPAASGLAVFLDPLRRKSNGGKFIRVAPLEAVPDDGVVREFPVIAKRVDAWNGSTAPVGAVYLRRTKGQAVPQCLTATCPHAGCFVAFDGQSGTFRCPCHNSTFEADGAIIQPSPSPWPMDTLNCKVERDEILVKFENFYCGKAEKIVKQ